MKSSDWCAKEKECSDSEGNRDRSSVKLGEEGPGVNGVWCPEGSIIVIEVERWMPVDWLREETAVEGMVGVRGLGC